MRAVVPVARRRPRWSRWSRSASRVERIDRQLRDDLRADPARAGLGARRRPGSAPGWSAAGSGGRRTGMGEREITRMYEYYRAVLHAVREGLLLHRRPTAGCSWSTTRRAGCSTCPTTWSGGRSHELGLPPGLVAAALGAHGRDRRRSTCRATACWWSARRPPPGSGRGVGAVVTLRDHTELQAVTGELDVVRGLTESLRSQNHEAANRLHTVVSLIEMGRAERGRRLRHRGAAGRPAARRPGGRRGRRPGARRAAARQDRRGRRARHRAGRRRASVTEPAATSRRATW